MGKICAVIVSNHDINGKKLKVLSADKVVIGEFVTIDGKRVIKGEDGVIYNIITNQPYDEIGDKTALMFLDMEKMSKYNLNEEDIKDQFLCTMQTYINICYQQKGETKRLCLDMADMTYEVFLSEIKKGDYNVELLELINQKLVDIMKANDPTTSPERIASLQSLVSQFIIAKKLDNKSSQEEAPKQIEAPSQAEQDARDAFKDFSIDSLNKRLKPCMDELDALVGLTNVKEEIDKLKARLIYANLLKDYLDLGDINLNMAFLGNPGTGKTTVAGIIAKMLYELGYLENDNVKACTASDLIAGYVGQTALKTKELLEKNKGGVIIIDEAYILASEHNSYSSQAIAELLKEMEKNRTAIIFAGYTNEMREFINMNPGLTSRISTILEFKDYSLEELKEIFTNRLFKQNKEEAKIKLHMTEAAEDKVETMIEQASKEKHFGNGRYVVNLVDKIMKQQALKVYKTTDVKELLTINEEDVLEEKVQKSKSKMGFAPNESTTMSDKPKVKTLGTR